MPATVIRILLFACLALPASSYGDASDPPEGRNLYVDYGCYQCHGYEGQGGLLSGPRIAPTALPFAAFLEILRRPYGVMPPYSEQVISDETLRAIHDYLLSIEEPPPGLPDPGNAR